MDGIGENLPSGYEIGFFIGAERESRSKAAEISRHCLVIGSSMIFTYLSAAVDPNSASRIGAQLVTGILFLGRGISS
jgi:putative Mg2+ transporter-C (MgtC) family protein